MPSTIPSPQQLLSNHPVQIQRTKAGESNRSQGFLVGNYEDEALIIGGLTDFELQLTENIIVRTVLGKNLVGFKTKVIGITKEPLVIYFLEFPEHLETVDLRKSTRIQAFFPADVKVVVSKQGSEELHMLKSRVIDISSGGCSFSSKKLIKPETEVNISFSLPGEKYIHSITGQIVESSSSGTVYIHRSKFKDLSVNNPMIKEISEWISENAIYSHE